MLKLCKEKTVVAVCKHTPATNRIKLIKFLDLVVALSEYTPAANRIELIKFLLKSISWQQELFKSTELEKCNIIFLTLRISLSVHCLETLQG